MISSETVYLDGQSLTLEDIWDIAHCAKKWVLMKLVLTPEKSARPCRGLS